MVKTKDITVQRMIIGLIEPVNTGTSSTCWGDSHCGSLPAEQVRLLMQRRADEWHAELDAFIEAH